MGTRISPRTTATVVRRRADALQHRQRERRGLAGAGRGLAEHVAAGEERRNRLALDVGRLFVAERGDRRHQRRVQAEGEKGTLPRRLHVLSCVLGHRRALRVEKYAASTI